MRTFLRTIGNVAVMAGARSVATVEVEVGSLAVGMGGVIAALVAAKMAEVAGREQVKKGEMV